MQVDLVEILSRTSDHVAEQMNNACGHIKILESGNKQLKEMNATLEARLKSQESLIKQLRAQQKEDPSQLLTEVHEYIQKLRDAQERKKRRSSRAISAEEGAEGGGGSATGGGE
jgi:hypothetical protein